MVTYKRTIRKTMPHRKTTFRTLHLSSGRLNNTSYLIHPFKLVSHIFSLQDNSVMCWKEMNQLLHETEKQINWRIHSQLPNYWIKINREQTFKNGFICNLARDLEDETFSRIWSISFLILWTLRRSFFLIWSLLNITFLQSYLWQRRLLKYCTIVIQKISYPPRHWLNWASAMIEVMKVALAKRKNKKNSISLEKSCSYTKPRKVLHQDELIYPQ